MSELPNVKLPDSLKNPESQAAINSLISAAVAEAVKAAFTQMAPVFEKLSLTPEKLALAEQLRRAPSDKELAKEAREKRERALMREELQDAERNKELRQEQCTHKDDNQRWAISLVHNYPDRQARGLCTHCHLMIQPTHWEIAAPDPQNPRGRAKLVQAHPLYHIVREIENQRGGV